MYKQLRFLTTMLLLAVCVGTWADDTYVKVTSTDDLVVGDVYLIAQTGTTNYVANGYSSGKLTVTSSGFTLSGNTITMTTATPITFVLGGTSDGYSLLINDGNGKYLGWNNRTNFRNTATTDSDDKEKWTITQYGSTTTYIIKNVSDNTRYISDGTSSGSTVFAPMSTSNDFGEADICSLYRKVTNTVSSPLASISILGTYPTTFRVGDTFSHEGMTVTATYEDATTKDVTANSTFSGYDMSTIGSQTVIVSYTEGEVTKTATYAITVEAIPTHTATFSINGQTTSQDFEEGATIEFPGVIAPDGYTFMGWVTSEIATPQTIAPTFVTGPTMEDANVTFFAVFAKVTEGISDVTKTYGFETESDTDWTIDGPVRTEGEGNTGSYAGKINSNNSYVTFNNKVKVKEFSFAFKRTSKNTNYNVSIETSTDNSEWTAAETYAMSDFSNGSYTTKTKSFDGNAELYVRFYCNNTTAIRYVDDVTITYSAATTTYSDYCTTIPVPSIIVTPTTISADAAGETANVTVTYEYVDQNVADVEFYTSSEATATTTCNWVHATFDANKNVELVIDANSGAARNAYMKVYSMDNETNLVYSKVITINQEAAPSLTINIASACTDGNDNYYGTFYSDKAYIMDDLLEGQVVSVDANGKLVVKTAYNSGDVVPAKTALLIYAVKPGSYKVYTTTAAVEDCSEDNMLKGTLTADEMTTGDNYLFYRLTMHNGTQIGFWWGAENGGAFKPGANKAYLAVPKEQAKAGFAFEGGDATSISTIDNGQLTMENAYNLQGQKVGSAYRGIVIVNGKARINK